MCAKQAKDTQTDYTRGGKAISDTAIPLYQSALKMQGDYLADPQSYIDSYLNKYWSGNTDQSDFLRSYKRAVGDSTANNYSATGGGYTSSGQRAYDDTQRYWNDAASRLQTEGVNNAANLVQNWYGNLTTGLGNYNTAYGLGKDYSNIERYNNAVDQNNSWTNQLAGLSSAAGKVFSAIPLGWTQAVGAGLQGVGNLASTDNSSLLSSLGYGSGGSSSGSSWSDIAKSVGGGLASAANAGKLNWLFGGNSSDSDSSSTGLFDPNSDNYIGKTISNTTYNSNSPWSLRRKD